jgi:sulfopyruvate decarboxylase subunit beta
MDQVDEEIVVSNIGDPSKEVFHIRDRPKNFYMLGSFGLASSISLGLALSQMKKVICLDGDGSLLTNLGTLATIANQSPDNLVIIALDNGVYGTTGNQKSFSSGVTDLEQVARACGFSNCFKIQNEAELYNTVRKCLRENKLCFIHVLIKSDSKKMNLIPNDPINIKNQFMKSIAT